MIMKIYSIFGSLLAFTDSNGIIAGISRAVEKQFKVNSDFGNLLKKDFAAAEKTFNSFEISFENDY